MDLNNRIFKKIPKTLLRNYFLNVPFSITEIRYQQFLPWEKKNALFYSPLSEYHTFYKQLFLFILASCWNSTLPSGLLGTSVNQSSALHYTVRALKTMICGRHKQNHGSVPFKQNPFPSPFPAVNSFWLQIWSFIEEIFKIPDDLSSSLVILKSSACHPNVEMSLKRLVDNLLLH